MISLQNFFDTSASAVDLEALETYKTILTHSTDLTFILDHNGTILSTNSRMEKTIGYKENELQNQSFFTFLPNYEPVKLFTALSTVRKGNPITITFSLQHRDGHLVDIDITAIPIKHDNKITGVIGIGKNISKEKQQERELVKIQENLNQVQMIGNTGSWDYDVIEDEAYWSKQMYRIFGLQEDSSFIPTYKSFLSFIDPNDRERFMKIFEKSLEIGESFQVEYRIVRTDGKKRVLNQQADVILDESGNSVRFIGTIQDITTQRRTEELLKTSEEQKNFIFNNLEVAIWSVEVATNRVLYCTKGFENIFGYPRHAVENAADFWLKVIHPDDFQAARNNQNVLTEGKDIKHQYRIIHASGTVKWVSDHTIPVLDEEGNLIRLDGIMSDITDQKLAEEKMSYLAHHDHLTKLPNSRMFDQVLRNNLVQAKEKNMQFAILYLNLDRFKKINDTLGHLVGDELLIEVSRRLNSLMPKEGITARMAGDEFAVILADIKSVAKVREFANDILQTMLNPFQIKGFELYMSTSIGVSIYPEHGGTSDTLMNHTKAAVNRAKQLGKNNVQLFSNALSGKPTDHYELEADMRKALINNEFEVYYQPRVCTNTGKILSAEALIRWNHPELGFLPPIEFIPLAEENGLISEIGDWVAKTVCIQLKAWQGEQLQVVPISINISAQGFLRNDVISRFQSLLDETNIDPHLLEIEITESSYMFNMEKVVQDLAELRKMGIKVALDDFGTGFSSLTQLKELKIDTLKIDRSFIKHIAEKKQDEVITSGIIELAHGLDIQVVAEGVETKEQLTLLRAKNCDQIQGYLFSKPIREAEFRSLLEKGFIQH
ncbi:EAL and GGDEF domain-containing protein [Halalkalibacter alkaliphilus]|uniref:EAL domain-containing protein n=1 Tax=Halalkalibacter alkaliphilus TaxID=2917993 RepID=A0A9X2A001_9BACI|nr:EAL domain-containing protein [Halalkalibacter alkaliphilus]MCL7746722.1 EAL domain-containing protein [Halalkalibacter alkaliphilus]